MMVRLFTAAISEQTNAPANNTNDDTAAASGASQLIAMGPYVGRVLVMLSRDASAEPRFQIADGLSRPPPALPAAQGILTCIPIPTSTSILNHLTTPRFSPNCT